MWVGDWVLGLWNGVLGDWGLEEWETRDWVMGLWDGVFWHWDWRTGDWG